MDPPKRAWDPNAPSILWAHEIRREHVQLINHIDGINTNLSSAVKEIATLQETVDNLTKQLEEQQHQREIERSTLEQRLAEIETRHEEKPALIFARFEALECENVRLRERLGVLEGHAVRVRAVGMGLGEPGQDIVPDSVSGPSTSIPRLSERTPSETTWGSLSDLDEPLRKDDCSRPVEKDGKDPDSVILQTVVQNGRTLSDYLLCADGCRARLSPGLEGRLVEVFLRGLDHRDVRGLIERRMGEVERKGESEWSWDVLVCIVRGIIEDQEDAQAKHKTAVAACGETAGETMAKRVVNRNRRRIPIIPADEEDALIVATMFPPAGG